jgi:hypothetical protein
VFRAEGIRIVRTAPQAPRMNAITERWVGSVRRELLDRTLIVNAAHLRKVLTEYEDHFNAHRPTPPGRILGLEIQLLAAGRGQQRDKPASVIDEELVHFAGFATVEQAAAAAAGPDLGRIRMPVKAFSPLVGNLPLHVAGLVEYAVDRKPRIYLLGSDRQQRDGVLVGVALGGGGGKGCLGPAQVG